MIYRSKNVLNYHQLMKLGNEEDPAISTMLMITLNLVKHEKKELQGAIEELMKTDDAEKESKIQEHQKKIQQYDIYVDSMTSFFGNIP